jgi:hypothetical protein
MLRYFAIATILAVSIITSHVQAGQKEKLFLAYTFVELSDIAKTMTDLVQEMLKPYLNQLKTQSKRAVPARAFSNILNEELRSSEDDLKWELSKIYVRNFTESELRAIVRFYKSPTGLALQAKAPILAAEGEEMGEKWMEEVLARTLERLKAAYGTSVR